MTSLSTKLQDLCNSFSDPHCSAAQQLRDLAREAEPTIAPRTAQQYENLAWGTRDDLRPNVRPSDWGSGTRNILRAALELFELLAAGATIVAAPELPPDPKDT